jgi:hypothetical protein
VVAEVLQDVAALPSAPSFEKKGGVIFLFQLFCFLSIQIRAIKHLDCPYVPHSNKSKEICVNLVSCELAQRLEVLHLDDVAALPPAPSVCPIHLRGACSALSLSLSHSSFKLLTLFFLFSGLHKHNLHCSSLRPTFS